MQPGTGEGWMCVGITERKRLQEKVSEEMVWGEEKKERMSERDAENEWVKERGGFDWSIDIDGSVTSWPATKLSNYPHCTKYDQCPLVGQCPVLSICARATFMLVIPPPPSPNHSPGSPSASRPPIPSPATTVRLSEHLERWGSLCGPIHHLRCQLNWETRRRRRRWRRVRRAPVEVGCI